MKKSGFIAIIGRPNSGKSTLLNKLLGTKIAIVSKIPQTTRNTIRGILTKDDAQIVFLDTPGIHESLKSYNMFLTRQAKEALEEADAVLYVVDMTRPIGREEEGILDLLQKAGKPVVIACNKTDIKNKQAIAHSLTYNEFIQEIPHTAVHYISALKGQEFDELVESLTDLLPEGEFFYPPSMISDQEIGFQVGEFIRESCMTRLFDEVPHSVHVDVKHVDEDKEKRMVHVVAEINVERESQKGLVIGKGAAKLKEIGIDARKKLEELFGQKVHLELRVKVDPNWRRGK